MREQQDESASPGRSLPRWARWLMLVMVFGGAALAFYFNFGRLFGRVFGE